VPGCERDDQIPMTDRQRARRHDQAAVRRAREGRDRALNLAGVAHVHRVYHHSQRLCHALHCGELANPVGRSAIPKDRRSRQSG